MQLEIATGFYQSFSAPLAAQRCINWEPIVPQASALSQRALRDVYGIDARALTGAAITGINRDYKRSMVYRTLSTKDRCTRSQRLV